MNAKVNRRTFLDRSIKAVGITSIAIAGLPKNIEASTTHQGKQYGTMIDLTLCDGCPHLDTPACVASCRDKNSEHYPNPVKDIPNYWPRKNHEDWSGKKDLTSRLTPYNWTYVQKVIVEDQGNQHELFIQRRCMHCDNPACANLCPFGVHNKTPEGAVVIDRDYCMGGAKCRDVCPWGIPQRQAGVGLYMKILPDYAGGGVMYKCDFCHDLLKEGKLPACQNACPKNAIKVGEKEEMLMAAKSRVQEIHGYLYGEHENGGTSTYYVSPVSFDKINHALIEQNVVDGKLGAPHMEPEVKNMLDTTKGYATSVLVAPIAGIFAAGVLAHKTMKGGNDNEQ
ncbi:oxidoreductase [Desulfuribacillus stibiiarsenatis]|uniref:Oxidoreductase n=1 Tax=Desulfuribacillus stibiiarsenatis TaxID=1390249 RepID=A0A1E5L7L4_9FIRM|nr:4Fe-4S dicluster domain-containing protein [Desulfuribacillus stibiiarsenatis]OEH86147.1 oxidoreductase [Desulfuribacillus stibiiarsenatis]